MARVETSERRLGERTPANSTAVMIVAGEEFSLRDARHLFLRRAPLREQRARS